MNHSRSISANDFVSAADDASMIQDAIEASRQRGINSVVVPQHNARTGAGIWTISRTIFLPSSFTLILDNAHLRMADGVVCRMFCNSNAHAPLGNTPQGRQHDIHIIGRGQAVLDGGNPNGLSEFTSMKEGFGHVSDNLTIFLHNVENFSIQNLHVVDQRWWAMAMMYCTHGRIERIRFKLTRHEADSYAQWRNQDGIDLRVGCSHISIREISGEVGDDLIALTALNGVNFEEKYKVEGASTDIHDIRIEAVRGITHMCALIRLLNHFGHRIHNITIRDVVEISRPGLENQTQMAIRIGDTGYYRNDPACRVKHGETSDIHIENLETRAMTAIITCGTIKNLTAKNIRLREDGQSVYVCGGFNINLQPFIFLPSRRSEADQAHLVPNPEPTVAENVWIENVECRGRHGAHQPALFRFNGADLRNVVIRNVHRDEDASMFEYIGDCKGAAKLEATD